MIALLAAGLLLLVLSFVGRKGGRAVLGATALAGAAAILLAFYTGAMSSGAMSRPVTNLTPGKTYLWKVIAEDGKGGSVQSQTRRFTIN